MIYSLVDIKIFFIFVSYKQTKQNIMKTTKQISSEKRWETTERINRLLAITRHNIVSLKLLSNGQFMSVTAFRVVLRENSDLRQRLETLEARVEKLVKMLWKL